MGYYIDPKNETKEEFLEREGIEITESEFSAFAFHEEALLVVLVDNGDFTAAIICYNDRELEYVQTSIDRDYRPKKFYVVDKVDVKKYLGQCEKTHPIKD